MTTTPTSVETFEDYVLPDGRRFAAMAEDIAAEDGGPVQSPEELAASMHNLIEHGFMVHKDGVLNSNEEIFPEELRKPEGTWVARKMRPKEKYLERLLDRDDIPFEALLVALAITTLMPDNETEVEATDEEIQDRVNAILDCTHTLQPGIEIRAFHRVGELHDAQEAEAEES